MPLLDLDGIRREAAPVPLAPEILVDIACGIAEARDLWAAHATHDPRERHPVRLLATETYEVWVIGWAEMQGVDMHDHAGSAGVLVVTEGELTERRPGEVAVRLGAGAVRELPATVVHEVANMSATPATSIHVYSPPLVAMAYYDEHGTSSIAMEPVPNEPPLVDARATALALHPAGGRG